jgi:hypothetical protein
VSLATEWPNISGLPPIVPRTIEPESQNFFAGAPQF